MTEANGNGNTAGQRGRDRVTIETMRQGLIGITAMCALLSAHRVSATTMRMLDLPGLVKAADRVVLGTVMASESHFTTNRDAIYTDVTISVSRSYKGAVHAGETIVVRREGGVVNGLEMRVFGAPHFVPGEEAVLFLQQREAATYVVGMTQGKLPVQTARDGRKEVLAADLSELHLLPSRSEGPPRCSLEQFESTLVAHIRAEKKAQP